MQNYQNALPSSSSSNSPPSSLNGLQFFVHFDRNHVIRAQSTDTILSIHEKLQSTTGIPIIEQYLKFGGKKLQWEQTLQECGVQNDSTLDLACRLRSTNQPEIWKHVGEVVSRISSLYDNNPQSSLVFFSKLGVRATVGQILATLIWETPLDNADQTAHYLHVFTASSLPPGLVMLYMSSHIPNKDSGCDAIKVFIRSIMHMHHLCVPIVLEFCNLLRASAGNNDPLYIWCRNKMITMIRSADDAGEFKISIRDNFPFVTELADKLLQDLVWSKESHGPSLLDFNTFTTFLHPVRNDIKRKFAFCDPIEVTLSDKSNLEADEIISLHGIFKRMLIKIDECLERIEQHMDWVKEVDSNSQTCRYLDILKELNSISKLYYGCEQLFWETIKQRKRAVWSLIARYAHRSNDHSWILEEKEATNFETRRHLYMMMLPEVNHNTELFEMLIDRSNLLGDSFEYIVDADPENLRANILMEFKNEKATGPGVLREWFFLVCKEIFNRDNSLFVACPNDHRSFLPNSASTVDPLHLKYFRFAGRIIALTLIHKVQVGIVFNRSFVLQLAAHSISWKDIQDADPFLYSSCKQILEMDPKDVDKDVLALTFVDEIVELGKKKIIELCPGGRDIAVNSRNRKKYIDSLIEHRFVIAIQEQTRHFAQGFADIMINQEVKKWFFDYLHLEDLNLMLRGSESEIFVDDWRAHTKYIGFKETDSQISWFWKIVNSMSAEQKKVLLFFWTSINYLPFEGFGGLAHRLSIYKTCESIHHLPSSHTCFYQLSFPVYPSFTVMRDRLSIIAQDHMSCSFGFR